jgi:cell surface protein SprA
MDRDGWEEIEVKFSDLTHLKTLEQSLIVDYNNLGGGHHGLVIQSFREAFNFLSYNKIRFWIYAEESEYGGSSDKQDSLIIRMGSDSLHYYEIRHELDLQEYYAEMDRDGWEEIEVKFSDLTHLKTLEQVI